MGSVTHALQDQHFDIASLLNSDDISYDQFLALRSFIEGDADLVGRAFVGYLARNSTIDLNSSVSQPQVNSPQNPDSEIFLQYFSFMYADGLAFATYLYSNGRWDAVNNAYTNLPQSTEQILQPRKYLAGDMPISVELADVSGILDDSWESVFTDTLGLFHLREYLSQYLSGGVVYLAVNGWGGDTISVYHQPDTDELAWMMGITWDDPLEKELREFGDAYVRFLENQFDEFTDMPFCGVSDAQTICFATTNTTSFIASAPTTDLAQALLTQLIGE